MALPHLKLETAPIPLELPPVRVETDLARAQRTIMGLAGDCPATSALTDSGTLPPEALVACSVHLLSSHYQIEGGIYAREQVTFHRPVRLGEQLTVGGEIAARFVKRGRLYRQVRSVTRDMAGSVVAESRTTSLTKFGKGAEPSAEHLGTAAAPEPGLAPLECEHLDGLRAARQGSTFTAPERLYTLDMMRAETGPDDRNPIHTDPEVARAAGLAKPIAGGPHVLSSAYELILSEFGGEVLSHGAHTDVRWLSPVEDGDKLKVAVEIATKTRETVALNVTSCVGDRLAMRATIGIPI